MPRKIFISYRRQDTDSVALGISQYLEREFGRKNVFIDVDMQAGANFPAVLEMRLAECKVLLALIGPDWLNARDDESRRRLDDPSDWVRLEIARALNRKITVIPVRVGGTALPKKSDLPEDVRGLVDHQAALVTNASFRNDMAGLARDIRAIPNPWSRARIGASIAGLLAFLVSGWIGLSQTGLLTSSKPPSGTIVNEPKTSPVTEPGKGGVLPTALRGKISFKSERGDYIGQGESWNVTDADGKFDATVTENSVSIGFHGDDLWDLVFVAPEGKRIEVGSYLGSYDAARRAYGAARRAPFNSPTMPGLSISGAGRGCNTLMGRFQVRQIAYSKSGDGIKRFAADFEQHCEGAKPALIGFVDLRAADEGSSADNQ